MVSWSGKLRQIMALMRSCGAFPRSLEHDYGRSLMVVIPRAVFVSLEGIQCL
jgi:hypothetical protein